MTAMQLDLFPAASVFAVHCFTCPHVVRAASPQSAHDLMEQHYAAKHSALISRLVGSMK